MADPAISRETSTDKGFQRFASLKALIFCSDVAEFYERLWGSMVDYVIVGADGGMMVVLRDGTVLEAY